MNLTPTQVRALTAIQHMCDSAEQIAHDFNGDLSSTSRNWPRTAQVLQDRGLIFGYFDHGQPIEEAWTYQITAAGRRALRAALLSSFQIPAVGRVPKTGETR